MTDREKTVFAGAVVALLVGAAACGGSDNVSLPGGDDAGDTDTSVAIDAGVVIDASTSPDARLADTGPNADAVSDTSVQLDGSMNDASMTSTDAAGADATPLDSGDGGGDAGGDGSVATCTLEPLPDGGTLPPIPSMSTMSACGQGYVTSAVNSCIGGAASTSECDLWQAGGTGTGAEMTCGSCIYGTTTTYGAVVSLANTDFVAVNVAGCVEEVDPSQAGQTCANDLWGASVCESTACAGCTVTDDPQGTMVEACYQAADNGECASYVALANADCAGEFGDTGAASVCDPSQYASDVDAIIAVGAAMCGGS